MSSASLASNPNNQLLAKLRFKGENKMCMDCGLKNPDWCSIHFGVFVCLECAGIHRGFGVHLTLVRSAVYDGWSDEQAMYIKLGGNERARLFFKKHGVADLKPQQKYFTQAAAQYKKILRDEVNQAFEMHKGNTAHALHPDTEEDYKATNSPNLSKTASKEQSTDDWGEFENEIAQDLEKTQISSTIEEEEDQYRVVKTVSKKKPVAIARKTPSGTSLQSEENLTQSSSSASVNTITSRLMNNEPTYSTTKKPSTSSTTTSNTKKKQQQNGDDYFEEWGSWEDNGNSKQQQEEEENSWDQDFSSNRSNNNNNNYSSTNNNNNNSYMYDPNFTPSQHTIKSANPERFRGIGSSSSMSNSSKPSARMMNRNIFDLDMETLKDMPPEDIAWYVKETAKVKGAVIAEKATELGSIALEKGKEVSAQVGQWISNWMNG